MKPETSVKVVIFGLGFGAEFIPIYKDMKHVEAVGICARQGAGHCGSHPHLVNKFVNAIIQGRESSINAVKAANITAAGLSAHESALKNGAEIKLPDFKNM